MNTQTSSSNAEILRSFQQKKTTSENQVAQEAQRLVNLYRQISTFRPSFIDEYNEMLLATSKEVQMIIPSIIGGPVVRQYLEHLQKERHIKTQEDEGNSVKIATQGYLPEPEEDLIATTKEVTKEQEPDINQFAQLLNAIEQSNRAQSNALAQALREFQTTVQKILQTTQPKDNTQLLLQAQQEAIEKTLQSQKNETQALLQAQQEAIEKTIERTTQQQNEIAEKLVNGLKKVLPTNVTSNPQKITRPIEYRPVSPTPGKTPLKTATFPPRKNPTVIPSPEDDVEILSEIDLSIK